MAKINISKSQYDLLLDSLEDNVGEWEHYIQEHGAKNAGNDLILEVARKRHLLNYLKVYETAGLDVTEISIV